MTAKDQTRKVLMIGTSLESKSGMSVSERLILENWKSERYLMDFVVTHGDGSSLTKISWFLKGLMRYLVNLIVSRPDIVYAHFSVRASFYRKSIFILIAKIFQKKVVLHSRTGEFGVFYDESPAVLKKFILFILNLVDALIVLGHNEKRFFESIFCLDRCRVIYNSIICPQAVATLTHEIKMISTMGSLGVRKGTYILLEAIPYILEEFPLAEFWLCGDGDIEKVQNLVHANGLDGNVKLPGWVKDMEKERIYLASCVYVLPSYHEGMPRSLLEAMSYGIPVVSTKVNAIPDLVDDKKTGLLIDPGDVKALAQSILTLLKDERMRLQMGRAARESILHNFNVKAKLRELENAFDEVVQ